MRLTEFIERNIEPILAEWEIFARGIWPAELTNPDTDPATLRDHAGDILRATVHDMRSDQSDVQQSDKSKGDGHAGTSSTRVDTASEQHGTGRVGSGFKLWGVMAEYRALRASVLRLWRESEPKPDLHDIADITRFNESIDQSLTESIRSYSKEFERARHAALDEHSRAQQLLKLNEALLISSVRQHEMTERAEREGREVAETANRAKDVFLATLSHEMRTPLNAIAGWLSILRSVGRSEEDLAEGLEVIERNNKAQVQLIEDVLDVSRIVSGKLRLEMRDVDLREVIDAGLDTVRPAAAARDIALHAHFGPSAERALCDPARIQQVVWNLVSNAVKFTPKGGAVHVGLIRERSGLQLTVADNGQGIAQDLLPYVFDRFRQADSSTRRKFGGLGLGLSIVKHLVEGHGGTVDAHSPGEGRGATFTVRLPIHAVRDIEFDGEPDDEPDDRQTEVDGNGVPLGTTREPAPPPVRLDGLRVMVVDDESDARRMLTKVLQSVGAIVTPVSGADDALAALDALASNNGNRVALDVLVSDLGMPERDGYDLIREVRRLGHQPRDLPAVALTGFAHKNDAHQVVLAGFQVHLPKPVDLHDLTAVIASLTGRTR